MVKKISVDFDNTLSEIDVQMYIKSLINKGIEVWIVTARYDHESKYSAKMIESWGIKNLQFEHNELFRIADELGISRDHIVFMNMVPKKEFFKDNRDFLFHLDDDAVELITIKYVDVVDVKSPNWIDKCNKLIG